MVDNKNTFGKRVLRTGMGGIGLFLCAVLLLSSCTTVPSKEEQVKQREANAREDVVSIKPFKDNINFEQPLSLEDVIRYGLDHNLEMRISKLDMEITNRETLAEKLRMLPSLRADATYEARDKLRKSDVYNWQTDTTQKDYTVSEMKDGTKANLVLTWNILDTLLASVRSGMSKMKEEVMEYKRKRQGHQLALDITESYWQAAAVEDALDYVHDVEKKLKAIKDKIEISVEQRQLDKMDASDAKMRLKELELTIRQLQANLSNSRLELSRLMGMNQNVQYTLLRPPIKPIVAALPHTKDLDIDRLEEYALLHRPELFATDMQVLIQKEDAKRSLIAMFPGGGLFAGYHYDSNKLLYSNTWGSAGAFVGWELLELPAKMAVRQGRMSAIEMAKAQRLLMTVAVITQVHIALLDYAIKVDRFRLLEETYMIGADLLRMAQEKNAVGRLPELAVTQRHLEEMASKLRRDEAVVDLLVAHKRLCVSIGVAPLDCETSLAGAAGGNYNMASVDFNKGGPVTGSGAASTMDTGTTPISKKWKCSKCGYIYEGSTPPDKCPVCGADKSAFVEYFGDELSDWGKTKQPTLPATDRSASTRSPGWAGGSSDQFLWKVQIGSFTNSRGSEQRLSQIKGMALRLMDQRDASVTIAQVRGQNFNRVRVMGLTESQARALAKELKAKGMEYWVIPPRSAHW